METINFEALNENYEETQLRNYSKFKLLMK